MLQPLQPPTRLPLFSLDTQVLPRAGKQDKIEIDIGSWAATVADREQATDILLRMGPPPPIYRNGRRTAIRANHGSAFGWMFNALSLNEWKKKRESHIRLTPLVIESCEDDPVRIDRRTIPPPIFKGVCHWRAVEASGEPITLKASLSLSLNPTRFVRHHSGLRPFPECARMGTPVASVGGEYAYREEEDNWLPLNRRLLLSTNPERWFRQVGRYFSIVEQAFEHELARVCDAQYIPWQRANSSYNVKVVETYWEWLSPDPRKVVEDLLPFVKTFSSRFRGERTYDNEESGDEGATRILRIQTAPGEWLKIYAKTNLRIRIEVAHKLAGKNDRFQFPRETDTQGVVRRISAHTFNSHSGVRRLLERLQTRAATMVNQFLTHAGRQARIVPSHLSAYMAVFHFARATVDQRIPSMQLLSELIHTGGITSGGPEERRETIESLLDAGIIESSRRGMYVPTDAYRAAFRALKAHGDFPIFGRIRRKSRPSEG